MNESLKHGSLGGYSSGGGNYGHNAMSRTDSYNSGNGTIQRHPEGPDQEAFPLKEKQLFKSILSKRQNLAAKQGLYIEPTDLFEGFLLHEEYVPQSQESKTKVISW